MRFRSFVMVSLFCGLCGLLVGQETANGIQSEGDQAGARVPEEAFMLPEPGNQTQALNEDVGHLDNPFAYFKQRERKRKRRAEFERNFKPLLESLDPLRAIRLTRQQVRERIRDEYARRYSKDQEPRNLAGLPVISDLSILEYGSWVDLADGSIAYVIEVEIESADEILVVFEMNRQTRGPVQIFGYDLTQDGPGEIVGPGSFDPDEQSRAFAPSINSERIAIEIRGLSRTDLSDEDNLPFSIMHIIYYGPEIDSQIGGTPGPRYDQASKGDIGGTSVCGGYQDINCVSAVSGVESGVVRIRLYHLDDENSWCSGFLIRDSETTTDIPYILTAGHCFREGTIVQSIDFWWQHDGLDNCASTDNHPWLQTLSTLVIPLQLLVVEDTPGCAHGADEPDWALFRFNLLSDVNHIPSLFQGKLTDEPPNDAVHLIHHPGGDWKSYSSGVLEADIYTHIRNWDFDDSGNNYAEKGSSGAPVIDADDLTVIGVHNCGDDCSSTGPATMTKWKDIALQLDGVFNPALANPLFVQEQFPAEVQGAQDPFLLTLRVRNGGSFGLLGGYIHVAFPDFELPADLDRVSVEESSFTAANVIFTPFDLDSNDKLKNRSGSKVHSTYLHVEATDHSWEVGEENYLTLRVQPKDTGNLRIWYRAAIQSQNWYYYNNPNDGQEDALDDDQDWPVYEQIVMVNPDCSAPPTPSVIAPTSVSSGTGYLVFWDDTSPNHEYKVEESTNVDFSGASQFTVNGTNYSFNHSVSTPTTYFYRVRAIDSCNGQNYESVWSSADSTTVNPGPLQFRVQVLDWSGDLPDSHYDPQHCLVHLYQGYPALFIDSLVPDASWAADFGNLAVEFHYAHITYRNIAMNTLEYWGRSPFNDYILDGLVVTRHNPFVMEWHLEDAVGLEIAPGTQLEDGTPIRASISVYNQSLPTPLWFEKIQTIDIRLWARNQNTGVEAYVGELLDATITNDSPDVWTAFDVSLEQLSELGDGAIYIAPRIATYDVPLADASTLNYAWTDVHSFPAEPSLVIADATPTLTSLSIFGPSEVDEENSASYIATTTWSDGTTTNATNLATWSENSSFANISTSGVLTTFAVTSDQPVTITASFTSAAGDTRTDTHSVTIRNVAATLTSLTISGPTEVNEQSSANYTATATWSDGTTTNATNLATWSEDSAYASISGIGLLTTSQVTGNQPVSISAILGGTASDPYPVIILDSDDTPAPVFEDNFETGDLSGWSAAVGTLPDGFGTAVMDGVDGPGEWDNAILGTVEVTLMDGSSANGIYRIMNDSTHLYFSFALDDEDSTATGGSLYYWFDNDADGTCENGDDAISISLLNGVAYLRDLHMDNDECSTASFDTSHMGSNDVAGDADPDLTYWEMSHPLDSGDADFDFSLTPGDRVRFDAYIRLSVGNTYVITRFPNASASDRDGEITIVGP